MLSHYKHSVRTSRLRAAITVEKKRARAAASQSEQTKAMARVKELIEALDQHLKQPRGYD